MRYIYGKCIAIFFLMISFFSGANASVVYTYTGNNFNDFRWNSVETHPWEIFNTSDNISIRIVFSDIIPAGTILRFGAAYQNGSFLTEYTVNHQVDVPSPVVVEDWTIASGPISFARSSFQGIDFEIFVIEESGLPYQWDIRASESSTTYTSPYHGAPPNSYIRSFVNTHPDAYGGEDYAATCLENLDCLTGRGIPVGSVLGSGTWTISSLPESEIPIASTASLFLLSLLALTLSRLNFLQRTSPRLIQPQAQA